MKAKFDFDDIVIIPEVITQINSRSEITIHDDIGHLPLFTAPMDTVVSRDNIESFLNNGIHVCLPRENNITPQHYSMNKNVFYAYSLADFRAVFLGEHHIKEGKFYALIDVANGHMPAVRDAIIESKRIYGDRLQLMVGNVANPATYAYLSEAGADYIRVGIGNGGGCLTTQQTGIGYPMGSLIRECYEKSINLKRRAKIVADGGFKKYSDIIKALGLGADYVMLGSILNKALESASENFVCTDKNTYIPYEDYFYSLWFDGNQNTTPEVLMNYGSLYKKFRGMSTKEVQKSWGNEVLKTSEGIVKYQKVEYTLAGWVENFQHYIKSAMSYTNSKILSDFIGNVRYELITENAFNRYNK